MAKTTQIASVSLLACLVCGCDLSTDTQPLTKPPTKPPVVQDKPPVVQDKPPAVQDKPPVAQDKPPIFQDKPLSQDVAIYMEADTETYEFEVYFDGKKIPVAIDGPPNCSAEGPGVFSFVGRPGVFAVGVQPGRIDLEKKLADVRSAFGSSDTEVLESSEDRLIYRTASLSTSKNWFYSFWIVVKEGEKEFTLSNVDNIPFKFSEPPANRQQLEWIIKGAETFRILDEDEP